MKRNSLTLAAIALVASTSATAQQSDQAKAFGAREGVRDISLSPDGTRVVVVVPDKGKLNRAMVFPIGHPEQWRPIINDSSDTQLRGCLWANDKRLVCTFRTTIGQKGNIKWFERLVAVDADGSNVKLLSYNPGDNNGEADSHDVQDGGTVIDLLGDGSGSAVLMTRLYTPSYSPTASDPRQGWGVDRVDVTTAKRQTTEQPHQDARGFITDGHGTIRIMAERPHNSTGYDTGDINYYYRKPGSQDWLPLVGATRNAKTRTGFFPVAVDRDLNLAYGFDILNGRQALYKVALDGSLKRDLVLADPNVDVDELISLGRQQRVVGISYATDRRVTEFFDPELKQLQASLAKALPPNSMISFVGANADESKLLLFVGSDIDPGAYMLFDKKTHHLDFVLDARPELDGAKLATVQAISYSAADGSSIPAYLTLPPGSTGKGLPTIVMPHGGPAARDEWGFDWLPQFYAARGYAVLQPNFRGSAGYGEAWFKENGYKSWKTAIGDVNDAGRWLIKQGIADPGKLAIVGWSYGGYAALQSAVLDPDLFKAIVAVAPVTDLDAHREDHRQYTDFLEVDAMIGQGPHVHEGSPAQNASRFKAPVLMFHGDADQNVVVTESRLMKSRLTAAGKQVDYVEFKGLDHQLDDAAARTELLDRSDKFLRATMGIK